MANTIAYLVNKKRICVVARWNEWKERNCRAHGFKSMTKVAQRDECELDKEEEHPYRLSYWTYESWEPLIADEREMCLSEEFIKRLAQLAATHPILNKDEL